MSEFNERLILPGIPNLHQIAVYEQNGGYAALRKKRRLIIPPANKNPALVKNTAA